jgi:hypothetical protein
MIWILLAIIVLFVVWVVSIYNGLVGARNGYKNAFAQIDVQLTRRTWSKWRRATSRTSGRRSRP